MCPANSCPVSPSRSDTTSYPDLVDNGQLPLLLRKSRNPCLISPERSSLYINPDKSSECVVTTLYYDVIRAAQAVNEGRAKDPKVRQSLRTRFKMP
jgi:hypothetical protein